MTKIVPVVMSGGSGTRLWPLSRKTHPKQLHALVTEQTMVQETVARVTGQVGDNAFADAIIVLNESQHDLARLQLEALGVVPSHFIVEPMGRNTAPVAAVAAELVAREHGEDALILLLPADHHIRKPDSFRNAIAQAAALAETGHIVTFGIKPDGPETGYGYIRRGEALNGGFTVARFTEKPDRETAQSFLDDGGYYWNAGIFMFGVGSVRRELDRHSSDVSTACRAALDAAVVDGRKLVLDSTAFATCPSISFDYAVMELTDHAAVVPADIGWSDVGAWSALWEIGEKDEGGNVVRGDVELVDARNSYVFSASQKVGIIGVEDLVVVATPDSVLVAHRNQCQDVKTIVTRLQEAGRDELL